MVAESQVAAAKEEEEVEGFEAVDQEGQRAGGEAGVGVVGACRGGLRREVSVRGRLWEGHGTYSWCPCRSCCCRSGASRARDGVQEQPGLEVERARC